MLLHTDPLKPPKLATFTNILWTYTPPHAIIEILVGAATHARLKMSGPLAHAIKKFGRHHWGGGSIEYGIFCSRRGSNLSFWH